MSGPVDDRVYGGESEDYVFLATAHDIEEVSLGNSFNVCVESAGVLDHTGCVHGLVYITDCDGRRQVSWWGAGVS